MRKFLPAAVAVAMFAFGGVANATELYRLDDPSGAFTGTYDCSYYTYDAQGNATKVSKTCSQTGYVAVYDDGVVACNGNQEYTRPDDGSALQGYIWVGPGHEASDASGESPGGEVGAGNNLSADDPSTAGTNEASGPCEG